VSKGRNVVNPKSDKAAICSCAAYRFGQKNIARPYAEEVANARLIACVPELLLALQSAAFWFDAARLDVPAVRHVRNAIAKATGNQE
jgi:hypothetical protein